MIIQHLQLRGLEKGFPITFKFHERCIYNGFKSLDQRRINAKKMFWTREGGST